MATILDILANFPAAIGILPHWETEAHSGSSAPCLFWRETIVTESICKSCGNAETNGGKCREFQASDGHYTWGTPIFQGDDETELLCSEQGGSFNSNIASCGHFVKVKECEFSQLGAYEMDCHCDRQCKWAEIGAYFPVCTDATKSFEAV